MDLIVFDKGGYAKVHWEDCRCDEGGEAIPKPGRTHYSVSGNIQQTYHMRLLLDSKLGFHALVVQIENEYGPVEWEIGAPGKSYTKWAAQMAVGLDTGVPWVMCKQDDAPDPVVSYFDLSVTGFFYLLGWGCLYHLLELWIELCTGPSWVH